MSAKQKKLNLLRGKNINKKKLLAPLLVLIVLLFAIPNLLCKYDYLSPDAAAYCSAALNIYHGHGYKDADYSLIFWRTPLFPIILAFSFFVFNPSLWVASFIPKISFCLSAGVIFWLGKKMFGLWEGVLGSLFILSAKFLSQLSVESILLDETQALFNLIFILACYIALEKANLKYYFISGISLSLSYLTRETALVGVFLLFGLWIFFNNYRTKRNFFGLSIFSASFFLIGYLPWKIYMNLNQGSSYFMNDVLSVFSLKQFFHYKMNIFHFIKISLIPEVGLYPLILFVLSCFIAIYSAFKGDRIYSFILMALFLFVGAVAHVSFISGHIGGSRFFLTGYFLCYLLVSRFLIFSLRCGYKKFKRTKSSFKYFILLISVLPLFILFSLQLGQVSHYWNLRFKSGSFKSWDNPLMKVGKLVRARLPRKPLYVNSRWYGRAIQFTSGGYPIYFSNLSRKNLGDYDSSKGALINISLDENNIQVVSEKDFFDDLSAGRTEYIIAYPPNWYHSVDLYNSYLEKSENFRLFRKIEGDESFKIYKIKKRKKFSNDLSAYIQKQEFINQMGNIYNKDKTKYMAIKRAFIKFGLENLLCDLERKLEKLSPTFKIYANFEDQVEFLGFDFESESIFDFDVFRSPLCTINLFEPLFKSGERMTISYYWRSKAAVKGGEYWVYGEIKNGYISIPITHQLANNGNYPVAKWEKEVTVKESYEYKIPEIAQTGAYRMSMSVYNSKSKRSIGKAISITMRVEDPVYVSSKRAKFLMEIGLKKEALREYMLIIEEYTEDQKNYETYKENYVSDHLIALKEAVNELEKAAKIYSDKADFHYILGLGLEKLGENSKAVKLYNNAISINPDHLKARHQRGLFYYKQGNIEAAIKEFEEVINSSPIYLETLTKLFGIYKNINNSEKIERIKHLGEEAASRSFSNDCWENAGPILATNGISIMKIALFSGNIELKINASGSLAEGIGPHFLVKLDGRKIGEEDITENMRKQTFLYRVENVKSGRHFLSVEFTNDANINGQDRNLFLGEVIVNYY